MKLLRILSDIFHDRSNFDFVAARRVFLVISLAIIGVSAASLGLRGLDLGIDFEGGTSWQGQVEEGSASASALRDVLRPLGHADAKVTILGADRDAFRVQALVEGEPAEADAEKQRVGEALEDYAGQPLESVSDVGPTFGEEITEKAVRALVVFLIVVVLYLAMRFEAKMAGAAMVALFHDVAITVGVYSLTGFEVTPATVIAILTILGYSLYDTVVVFDKVKDNTAQIGAMGSRTYSDMVNRSLNQVLMRSINTSITTIIPVLSLLVVGAYMLGAVAIRDFSLALFVGLLAGTYSSIFVAAPVLATWKEREPRYRAMRERIEARQGAGRARTEVGATAPPRPPAPAPAPAPTPGPEGPEPAGDAPADEAPPEEPPRPRGDAEPAPGGDGTLAPRGRRPRRRKRR